MTSVRTPYLETNGSFFNSLKQAWTNRKSYCMQIRGSAAAYGANGVSSNRESFYVQWLTNITKELQDCREHK